MTRPDELTHLLPRPTSDEIEKKHLELSFIAILGLSGLIELHSVVLSNLTATHMLLDPPY